MIPSNTVTSVSAPVNEIIPPVEYAANVCESLLKSTVVASVPSTPPSTLNILLK